MIREIPKEAIEGRKAAHLCFGMIAKFQLKHKKHPPAILQLTDHMFTYTDNIAKVVLVYQHFNLKEYRQFEIPFNDEFREEPDGVLEAHVRLGSPGTPKLDVVACYSDLDVSNQDYVISVFDAWILDWLPLEEFMKKCNAKIY